MANYLKEAFKALFGGNNDNNKELKETEKAGNKAAEIGEKNAGFVPKVNNVNEIEAAEAAKAAEKTKGRER